ncbi:MAG: hypothetical protein AYK18_07900 [Theionarchaea archaeon DG-70]|nr:MAG: hypothetical protein AYK18_07900 [Theionarchaea archaeon DG-70]
MHNESIFITQKGKRIPTEAMRIQDGMKIYLRCYTCNKIRTQKKHFIPKKSMARTWQADIFYFPHFHLFTFASLEFCIIESDQNILYIA